MEILNFVLEYIIPFLIVISLIVFFHEFGHFLTARLCGVKVEVFSLGFGRELCGFNDKTGTRWKISAIPMGGYVRMFGDADEASSSASKEEFTEEEKKVSFRHQNVFKRFVIVLAGPFVNFILAVFLFTFVYSYYGQQCASTVISKVTPNSAAEEAGFLSGDKIVEINGDEISCYMQVRRMIRLTHGATLSFVVMRDGKKISLTATPRLQMEAHGEKLQNERAVLGIVSTVVNNESRIKKLPLHKAFAAAVEKTGSVVVDTFIFMKQMMTGVRSAKELGGPVQIAETSGEAAQKGMMIYLSFIAVISITLGLINLFPVPLLDGGYLIFYLIEAVTGKPLNAKAQDVCFRFGMGIVVCFMVLATWNDFSRIIKRVFF